MVVGLEAVIRQPCRAGKGEEQNGTGFDAIADSLAHDDYLLHMPRICAAISMRTGEGDKPSI